MFVFTKIRLQVCTKCVRRRGDVNSQYGHHTLTLDIKFFVLHEHAGGIVETSVASGFSKSCWKRYISIIYTICKQRIVTKICRSPST